tara:strand:+ start:605 stop:1057 length:453 start_codon:yes stop_codon:yes gene_type:complete
LKKKILKFNLYTFFNLPSAWWSGVRVTSFDDNLAEVSVRHRWVNQNPFGSIFWAVQGMAAELSTAIFVMRAIKKTGLPVSMLVLNNNATFKKKARGLIKFHCIQGMEVSQVVENAISEGKAKKITLKSIGKDMSGDVVSAFEFEWTIKRK